VDLGKRQAVVSTFGYATRAIEEIYSTRAIQESNQYSRRGTMVYPPRAGHALEIALFPVDECSETNSIFLTVESHEPAFGRTESGSKLT